MTKDNKETNEVEALVEQMSQDGDLGDIDPNDADLTLPDNYLVEHWAQMRVAFVRDAQNFRLQAAGNRVVNPTTADDFEKKARLCAWLVAAIDRRWPEAKLISIQIATIQAWTEQQNRQQAFEATKKKKA